MFFFFRLRRSFTALFAFCAAACAVLCLCVFIVSSTATDTCPPGEDGLPLPVIMYHSVCINHNIRSPYILPPDDFEEDMRYLLAHGYRTVFISDVINYVKNNGELPEKPVVISLDDGFYNNLTNVLPILEKYDLLANVNVVGEFTAAYENETVKSPAYAYLSWKDIRTMHDSGHIEIGSHTYAMHSTSPRNGCSIMRGEAPEHYAEVLKNDLSRLREALNDKCGIATNVFAYPYGALCAESVPVLRSLGFEAALTCDERVNRLTGENDQLFRLGRINRPSGCTTEEFMRRHGIE